LEEEPGGEKTFIPLITLVSGGTAGGRKGIPSKKEFLDQNQRNSGFNQLPKGRNFSFLITQKFGFIKIRVQNYFGTLILGL